MILAVEDLVSAAAAEKLIRAARPGEPIQAVVGLRGKGYLEARARELNRAAASIPVLMLVDLDTPEDCPPAVVQRWFGTMQPNLSFRIAVMEVEAWLLADGETFARFLGVPSHRIPRDVDSIQEPKQLIVNVARRSRLRHIREDLVPQVGATTAVGPAYNARLVQFTEQHWQPESAALASESLRRALVAVARRERG